MARTRNKLTVAKARSITKPGRHSDGDGLYLKVRKSGSKAYVFISKRHGREKEIGLGGFNDISLAAVRDKADELRKALNEGEPLKGTTETKLTTHTFKHCMEYFLESKQQGWTNAKHREQWHNTLNTYAKPLHNKLLTEITTPDIFEILQPIWLTKNETASRLRGRIEAVLDYGRAMGWREGENPAVWRGNLKVLLPAYSKVRNVKHHAALPYTEMPKFMAALLERDATVARMMQFIILNASRSGEVRFATWNEVDFDARTWTVPADRMKMGKEHTVPLSDRAYNLLVHMDAHRFGEHIFSHPTSGKAFSVNGTIMLLKRMDFGKITTHGFRSTFRDWAGDKTMHQRETIEAALAHSLKDRAEAAYRRSSALEKRRMLMQDWADHCFARLPI